MYRKGKPCKLLVKLYFGTVTMGNSMGFLKKLKKKPQTAIRSSKSASACIFKGNEKRVLKPYPYSHVHCSIICNSRNMGAMWQCIMDKEDVVCACNRILFSYDKEKKKRKRNPAICNNMGRPWGYYAMWTNTDRERQILHGNTYMCTFIKVHTHRNRVERWFPGLEQVGGGTYRKGW